MTANTPLATAQPRIDGHYGERPVGIDVAGSYRLDLSAAWTEFMHYLYLPVRIPQSDPGLTAVPSTFRDGLHVPRPLAFLTPAIDAALADAREVAPHLADPYVYVTARRGFASPGNPLNRPGWHCFSDDTEVLTRDGWKTFPDLLDDDEILSLNRANDESRWAKITEIIRIPFDGELNVFEGRRANFAITDQHRLYARRQGKPYTLETYEDLPETFWMKGTNTWGGGTNSEVRTFEKGATSSRALTFSFYDWAEFLGWYVSEGSTNKGVIQIGQVKGENNERIALLMERMGFKVWRGPDRVSANSLSVARWLAENCGVGAGEKRVPVEIKDASTQAIERFLESFGLGDGTPHGHGTRYYTSSESLADDLHEVLCKLGRARSRTAGHKAGTVAQFKGKSGVRKRDIHIVTSGMSRDIKVEKKDVRRVPYTGDVWCLRTPDEVFMVRRKGKPMWSGNCDDFGGTDLNYIWADKWPTRFVLSDQHLTLPEDDAESMNVMATLATSAEIETERWDQKRIFNGNAPRPAVWMEHGDTNRLLRLSPYVIHDTPLIFGAGGMRSFFKISVSTHRYDLVGNSHNYDLAYEWEMHSRQTMRNKPQGGNADYSGETR
jgi:hypothetical protein